MTQSRQDWPQQPDLQQEMQPVLPQMRPDWPVRQMPPIQIPDNQPEKIQEKNVPKNKIDETISVEESDVYVDEDETKPTEPPKKKQRKHKNKSKEKENKKHGNDEQPMHEQLQLIRKDLDMEFADHDGAAERPGGAVLSLTLGKFLLFIYGFFLSNCSLYRDNRNSSFSNFSWMPNERCRSSCS